MRKLILIGLIAAAAIPGVANAQMQQDVRHDRREVRQDRQDLRGDRRNMRLDRRAMRQDRRAMRQDRRSQRQRIAYVAPSNNWTYRALSPGYQLESGFYSPRYYVNDYSAYQLSAPRRFQRWIRYGNDLILVNVRNGRVLRVLHNRYY